VPGWPGMMLALACSAVVFVAGAKLLDSVRPEPVPAVRALSPRRARPRLDVSRNRRRLPPQRRGAASRSSLRKD
jgi:hypothetical protein